MTPMMDLTAKSFARIRAALRAFGERQTFEIRDRTNIVARNLLLLESNPDNASLKIQTAKNIADLEAEIAKSRASAA